MKFRPFTKARDYVRTLKLKNQMEWQEYCKSRKPSDIPSLPNRVYKDTGWINLGDWLGTGNVAPQNRRYRPFEECKAHVHKLSLKNREDWLK